MPFSSPLRLCLASLCALAVLCCFGWRPSAARADAAPQPVFQIPFSHLPGHRDIIVRARINDRLTGNFLLDTGSPVTLVDEDFARKLGVKLGSQRLDPLYMAGHMVEDIPISRLSMGALAFKDLSLVVEPGNGLIRSLSEPPSADEIADALKRHPELRNRPRPLTQTLDGIIGMDIFENFALMIDFQSSQITVWPYGKVTPQERQDAGIGQAAAVPLDQPELQPRAYYTDAEFVNGSTHWKEKMLVDTGAEATLVTPHMADRMSVAQAATGRATTFYGKMTISLGLVERVSVGSVSIPNVIVQYTHNAPDGFPRLLGYNVLSQCRVLLDFPAQRLYLQPGPDAATIVKSAAQVSQPIAYTPGANGGILLPVQFQDGTAGTFAIDSLAARTQLSLETAMRLKVALSPMLDDNGAPVLSGGKPVQAGKLPLIRFGGTGAAGLSCVASQPTLTVGGRPVDGVLGSDFLSAFLPCVDFQRHEITFLQGSHLKDSDLARVGMPEAASVPVVKPDAYPWGVTVQITGNGQTADATFLASTRDADTVLSSTDARSLGAPPDGATASVTTPFGEVAAKSITLDDFSLAGVAAPSGIAFHVQTDSGFPLPFSVLGLDVLTRYRVLLDLPDGRLYLAPPLQVPVVAVTP